VNEDDLSPQYAINLAHMKPAVRDPSHGRTVVTLETALGDHEYEISLEDTATATTFATAVRQQAAAGEAEIVRKVRSPSFGKTLVVFSMLSSARSISISKLSFR
jgi:hypothetical protein